MNWTGGRLQRHSKPRDAEEQRRRAYFAQARVQSQTQDNLHHSPFMPDFLLSQHTTQASSHGSGLINQAHRHIIAPPRQGDDAHHVIITGNPTGDDKPRHTHRSGSLHSVQPAQDVRTSAYLSRRPDDKTGSTLRVDEARRRLLQQTDWAGLRILRPLNIGPAYKNRDSIGKRRHVSRRVRHEPTEHLEHHPIPVLVSKWDRDHPAAVASDLNQRRPRINIQIGSELSQSRDLRLPTFEGRALVATDDSIPHRISGESVEAQPTDSSLQDLQTVVPRKRKRAEDSEAIESSCSVDHISISDDMSESSSYTEDDFNLFHEVSPPRIPMDQRVEQAILENMRDDIMPGEAIPQQGRHHAFGAVTIRQHKQSQSPGHEQQIDIRHGRP